jgi:branched-chain amino acid transport system substrate-binding protein
MSGLDNGVHYREQYDYAANFIAAQSSAAVLVYKEAFERANAFDPQMVRDALASTNMQTFYGPIKFSDNGINTAKPMVLRQIICHSNEYECEYVVVAPTNVAPKNLIKPD